MPGLSTLTRSIVAAGLVIGTAALIKWLEPTLLGAEGAKRGFAILIGVYVIYYANKIPKAAASGSRRRSAGAEQASRRFAGWAMVSGGLGYMAAWLFAPIELANIAAGVILGGALLLALLRCRASAKAPA
jgi:hypothetical protein